MYPGFPFADVPALTRYAFTKNLDVYFCANCGSTLVWYEEASGGLGISTAPILDDDVDASRGFDKHEFVGDTTDGGLSIWLPRDEDGKDLPKYVTGSGRDPKIWSGPADSSKVSSISNSDPLPAHCHCKGVQFWLTRPDEESASIDATASNLFKDDPNPPKKWWLDQGRRRYLAGHCGCKSCRLASGSEVVQWAFVPEHNIRLDEAGKKALVLPFGSLQSYRSSENVTRYFCDKCGAMVFWTSTARPGLIDVAVGLLEAEEGARAETWLSWDTRNISFQEDSHDKSSLIRALVDGMQKTTL
ncbi:MAG: hypothetical protein M1828_001652 [Chrysothrix sp. TS-e1954]|nr:MAG: hypothetical protein M1828_001652 [Chrysothrix sp. TS-e1954]